MVIMDAYYPPDRLQEIWKTIDLLHLSYLEMEESSQKLEHRIRLEDCIREFLCIAAHSQKFYLPETAEILNRSASCKKDFSGYKAATGWNAIQLYAGNLLSQPWRKEYRQIKTYCGFYKHQIEANLVGAEIMFEAMGYKHCTNGILMLEGPICPDTVANVSKDCLIAYVECQILKAIWEEITPTFKISWLEVLDFRKNHLCSPEQSIKFLNYQFHEKQYHQAQNSEPYVGGRCHSQPLPMKYPQFPTHNHVTVPYAAYGTNCCANNYATYAHVPYSMHHYSNGYHCTNGLMGQPHGVYGYAVPTGQLIDHDSGGGVGGGYDVVDKPSTRIRRNSQSKKIVQEGKATSEEAAFEDWDYVYRTLHSQGYSKDLGERGDLLSSASTSMQKNKTTKMTNLDVEMQAAAAPEPEHSRSSSYENVVGGWKATKTKLSNNKKSVSKNGEEIGKFSMEKWECKSCTFHNANDKDICEMCCKSRTNVEPEMEVGGPQCSKCTLVNAKDSKECKACRASLKNSPTYI